jgi:hypothetical protein
MTDRAILNAETDARFAAQSGVTHKLNPSDPTDAALIPLWNQIFAKVQAEDAAGHLVLTYNHPVVAQNLADAHAASQAAAAHLDAAVAAPDPATAQQHVDAATDAANVAKQKAATAASVQPPSADPQVAQAASANAAQQPKPKHGHGHGHKHVAQAQAEGAGAQVAQTQSPGPVTSPDAAPALAPTPTAPAPAAAHVSRDIIDRETDARFWATGYKPGQKLNPNDPQDAKMIPVWLAIYKQVQAEDAAGRLVLTYNNPVVAQNIADAHVADQVAAQHIDAAAQAPDPATQQQHVEAATQATQVSAQKTAEVAQVQPASVPPPVAHQVARQADSQPILVRDTYRAFWRTTHYKVGHPLNPHDPNDARWIPTWLAIYQQVQQAHGVVQPPVPPTAQAQIAQTQAAAVGHRVEAQHRHRKHHGPVKSSVHPDSVREYRKAARQLAHAAGGQFVLVTVGPDGTPTQHVFGSRQELDAAYAQLADQHDQYKYIAAFDLTASPHKPVVDSVGIPAAEHVETPPSGPSAGAPADSAGAPDQGTAGTDSGAVEPEKKSHFGTILMIGAGVAVAGGIVYAATKKPSRGMHAPRSKVVGLPVAPMALARTP